MHGRVKRERNDLSFMNLCLHTPTNPLAEKEILYTTMLLPASLIALTAIEQAIDYIM